MLTLIPTLILLYTPQLSTAASADGESCTTGSTCATGSTCYRGFCTPGLNTLPCDTSRNCFGTAKCVDTVDFGPICVRPARCFTSKECFLHETCNRLGLCIAGFQSMPCKTSEECLPFYECRNSRCNDARSLEGPPTTLADLNVCLDNVTDSLPEPNLIQLPSWLLGALGFIIAVMASQAPQIVMKSEDVQRRRTIFKLILAGSVVLWVAFFVLAVIEQVSFQREVSRSSRSRQAIGICFQAVSAIHEQVGQKEEAFSKQVRIGEIGFFCEDIASIVFTLAVFWLIWRYLQEYPSQKLHVPWKKVALVGLAVVGLGLTGIFVGAKFAKERVQIRNPYCEILTAFGNEYLTCALSIGNTAEVLDESFTDEIANVCSEMTLQSIQTGNIPSLTLEEFLNVASQFTSSEKAFQVFKYMSFSRLLALAFFVSSVTPNFVVLRVQLAFLFLKVIFELMLSILLIRLVYKSKKVTVLTVMIAVILVICELVVRISGSVYTAGIELQGSAPEAVIVCGNILPDLGTNGVLDRSFSPEAREILTASTTFIFVVIGFKELFTDHSKSNEAVDDERNSTGTIVEGLER